MADPVFQNAGLGVARGRGQDVILFLPGCLKLDIYGERGSANLFMESGTGLGPSGSGANP